MPRSPQLVTSLHLESFFAATRRDAQAMLPLLVLKLIAETTSSGSLEHLRMASGDDIRLPGWDGVVRSLEPHPFVPVGLSAWEMGVGSDPEKKADLDYAKRTGDPAGIDVSNATFVFVTPHVWTTKAKWETARKAEGKWKSVHVIDGDVLAQWFNFAVVTAYWFRAECGLPVDDLEGVDLAWKRFVEVPLGRNGGVPASFMIAGRVEEQEKLATWLAKPSAEITIAAESIDEALAFVLAVVKNADTKTSNAELSSRLLVARSVTALQSLGSLHTPHVVIAANSDVASELRIRTPRNVHMVCLAVNAPSSTPKSDDARIHLARPKRTALQQELKGIGYSEKAATRIAGESRGSMEAILWGTGSPKMRDLPWLREPMATLLKPLVLVRSWDAKNPADQQVIETLSGRSSALVGQTVAEWSTQAGPLQRSGNVYEWKAWRAVWEQLCVSIPPDIAERFETVCLQVLGATDPALELDPSERWLAAVRQKVHPNSRQLRDGLASSIAMFATLADQGQSIANSLVHRLLDTQTLGTTWVSLASWLPDLAEAAPDTFITLAEKVARDPEAIASLFADAGVFGSHSHPHLLWALERLAWDPNRLARIVILLGRFSEKDPGGNLANRPEATLRGLLLPWYPGSNAPAPIRLAAFDQLIVRCPEVAWRVGLSLLPREHSDLASPAAEPEYREWGAREREPMSRKEYAATIVAIIDRIAEMVGHNAKRWQVLAKKLPILIRVQPERAKSIIKALFELDTAQWSATERRDMGEQLRDLVKQHEEFAKSDWALSTGDLELLRPLTQRFSLSRPQDEQRKLFALSPRLDKRDEESSRDRQKRVAELRHAAVVAVKEKDGIAGILAWASDVESPETLGGILAESTLTDLEAQSVLDASVFRADPKADLSALGRFAGGFIRSRARVMGPAWVDKFVRKAFAEYGRDMTLRVALAIDAQPSLWELLRVVDPQLSTQYWSAVQVAYWDLATAEVAVPQLIAQNRPYAAISVVATVIEDGADLPKDTGRLEREQTLVRTVLALTPGHSHKAEVGASDTSLISYYLEKVLEFADKHADGEELTTVIARWEWQWLSAFEDSQRGVRTLHRLLAESPSFFVEVLTALYRKKSTATEDGTDGEQPIPSEEERVRATQAWKLLQSWHRLPGLIPASVKAMSSRTAVQPLLPATPAVEGSVDPTVLHSWVEEVRRLAAEVDRLGVCERHIGEIFAYAPADSDGSWPSSAVRAEIERLESADLERGLRSEIYNRRGVHAIGDTGDAERAIARAFTELAERVKHDSIRTADVLRQMANTYSAEAQRRDEEGRRDEFDS